MAKPIAGVSYPQLPAGGRSVPGWRDRINRDRFRFPWNMSPRPFVDLTLDEQARAIARMIWQRIEAAIIPQTKEAPRVAAPVVGSGPYQ